MAKSILIVDDEKDIREPLAFFLSGEGFATHHVGSGEDAMTALAEEDVHLVISDIRMPGMDGLELVRRITARYPQTAVMIMTAYASIDTAIMALRTGATDYILKPVDLDELLARVHKLMKLRELRQENAILRRRLHDDVGFESIIGRSAAMADVFSMIRRVAGTRSTVLITGKSGTGKELVAKAIHHASDRADRVFLPVNCGAISESLIESELFGHRRGSFTDAYQDKQGVFQLADGGTLFLDEVGEIPLHLQVKLLRAIDEREVLPVGGSSPVSVDVRIVCATNQDLQARIKQGLFREDLYYRLNVVEIHLPPLSERAEDIPLLVDHFVTRYRQELGKAIAGVDNRAMRLLLSHSWPGGVRELENVIERAVIFCDGEWITCAELPDTLLEPGISEEHPESLREAMMVYERRHLVQVLRKYQGNKDAAAKALGIGLSSLYRKIEELNIVLPQA